MSPIPLPDDQPAPGANRATIRRALLISLALALTIIVADQFTKAWITQRYGPCGRPDFHPVIGAVAGFSYVCNTGTAFSRLRDSPIVWLPVSLALGVVLWLWLRSLSTASLLQQVAFGLIVGGGIGNALGRARLGYVVDFVDLRLSDTLRFYVFNVADAALNIGIALLALAYWRTARPTQTTHTADPAYHP